MKPEICTNCAYDKPGRCEILKKRSKNCVAYADEKEKQKRENAIKKYIGKIEVLGVQEKLERHFEVMYDQGYSDMKIAEKLDISAASVSNYRKKRVCQHKIKNRSASTETAKEKTLIIKSISGNI